jgi:hypothetical protein
MKAYPKHVFIFILLASFVQFAQAQKDSVNQFFLVFLKKFERQVNRQEFTELNSLISFPICYFGHSFNKDKFLSQEREFFNRYTRRQIRQIKNDDVIRYDSKLEHPFYKADSNNICFDAIDASSEIYEIDIQNGHPNGPAIFLLFARKKDKYLLFCISA